MLQCNRRPGDAWLTLPVRTDKRSRMQDGVIHRANPATLAKAARELRAGRLVAFPTETVYGLGADATSEAAVARIFEAKGRPRFNPLISHIATVDAALGLGRFSPLARSVAARFWPGPLTIIVERTPDCPIALLASAGLSTVALRVPGHPLAQELLRRTGRPVAAPSANRSGRTSPTRAEHVAGEGLDCAMILDGGDSAIGLESTVLDLSGPVPVLCRPGAVTLEMLEAVLETLRTPASGGPPVSPGMLASHYAPACEVRLDIDTPSPGETYLAFGPVPDGQAAANLSPAGDLVEAAANLFRLLRELDRPETTAIAVAPIPETGLGRAINDRLRRAAAPRAGG